jgi:hypothetical protein
LQRIEALLETLFGWGLLVWATAGLYVLLALF